MIINDAVLHGMVNSFITQWTLQRMPVTISLLHTTHTQCECRKFLSFCAFS